ncbi:MAG: hypothetical protein SWC96_03955 [Thermodesulfobacteriota bacterium]|nr:hypothetical protein [Thermodesulfobacteriota bacterium]
MSYLEKLKSKTSHLEELPKVPKGVETENKATPPTAKSAKTPFDSKDSYRGRRFSEIDYCPARCKRTGLCYGRAYFEGKADGSGRICNPSACPWAELRTKDANHF